MAFGGDNIDDTFVAYVRSELQNNSRLVPVDVLNAGIPGYTNWQELVFLKKYGLKFRPDLVGVQFCLNDLPKILHQFEVENGRIVTGYMSLAEEVDKREKKLDHSFGTQELPLAVVKAQHQHREWNHARETPTSEQTGLALLARTHTRGKTMRVTWLRTARFSLSGK